MSRERFDVARAAVPGSTVEDEDVTGIPVLAEARPLQPFRPPVLPVVQAAAVAATSFVAGAATLAVVRRTRSRRLGRRGRRRRSDRVQILSSRSFLVDVHLVNR